MVRRRLVLPALLLAAGCHHDAAGPPPGPTGGASATPPALAVDAGTPGETVLRLEDDGKTVDVARGAVIVIKLELSSGTGFSWVAAAADAGAPLVQQGERTSEQASDGGKPGAPRLDVFRFVANAAGTRALAIDLKRPWETETPPARTFHVTVRVR